jgi:Na+/melibiose symporter-like transporter
MFSKNEADNVEDAVDASIYVGKTVLAFLTGAGVSRIVGGLVMILPPQTSLYGKIAVRVAQAGIAYTISTMVEKEENLLIDTVVAGVKEFHSSLNETSD